MAQYFTRISATKILISFLCGLGVFVVSWFYLNSYYTLSVEDELFSKEVFVKHKLLKIQPKKNKAFVFISTGKDLNLVNDNTGYGNVAVSDRYKLLKFLQAVNAAPVKPQYVLLDLQFYYPYVFSGDSVIQKKIRDIGLGTYFPDKRVDDSLQTEITKLSKVSITVLMDHDTIVKPIFKASYGIADYKTYGAQLNKFRINYADLKMPSIPCLLNEQMDGAVYTGGEYNSFCNGHLCFDYIFPGYYYDEAGIKGDSTYQVYHIGELTGLPNNAPVIGGTIANKVVCIGNFENDVHVTPRGKINGTVILADVYLSLLNHDHYVSYPWIVFIIIVFTILSYVAIYNSLPDLNLSFGFAFAKQAVSYIKQYVSFIGILMLCSILSVLLFNMMISLFLPAFIFSTIDFLVKRKYK